MPAKKGGKTRGRDVTLWISTSSSIVNRFTKRVGDRWSRRFIITAAHRARDSLANVANGENINFTSLETPDRYILYPYFFNGPRR